jgi:integrating conjugative element protein (TIGR03761 family)
MTAKTPGRGNTPPTSPAESLSIKPRSKPLLTLPKKKKMATGTTSPSNNRTPSAKSSAATPEPNNPASPTPAPRHKGLEMKAMMTVHTNLALQMWQGREQDIERDMRPIIGITRFASGIAHIWNESARDNPMADWILLIAEERHQVASDVIDRNLKSLKEILEGQEFFDDIESATNIRPIVLPLNFHCPWGYKAATLLKKFDDVVRLSLTATHLGLVTAKDWEVLVRESARRMRGFLGVVAMDLRVHLERGWFNKRGNKKLASAKQELRKLGKTLPYIPQDVMSGARRAVLSPAIQTAASEAVTTENAENTAKKSTVQQPSESVGGAAGSTPADNRRAYVQPIRKSLKKDRAEWGFDFYRLKSDQPLVDLNQDTDGSIQDSAADQENAGNE